MEQVKGIKEEQASADAAVTDIATQRDEAIMTIGNLVHDSVPVDDDEVRSPAINLTSKRSSVIYVYPEQFRAQGASHARGNRPPHAAPARDPRSCSRTTTRW